MNEELVSWKNGIWKVRTDRGWVLLLENVDTGQILWVDPLKVSRS